MRIFKFRVIIDTEEDIFRDIEVSTVATFEELHLAILHAFDWKEGEMASFYQSNDMWERGMEIPLMDMFEDGIDEPAETAPGISMKALALSDIISKPDEKLIYVYDFLRMWCFYIELQEVKKAAPDALYPRVSMVFGDAPDIESKEVDLMGDLDFLGDLGGGADSKPDLTGDPEIDQYLKDQDDLGDDNYSSLDDLDENYI